MRRLVASLFMSLDGVIESPERWAFPCANEELETATQAQMDAADALLLGRVTYQEFVGCWPHRDGPGADSINAAPKYVVSSRLTSANWHNTTLLGDIVEAVTALKEQPGKSITTTGSATLFQAPLRAGLLDELRLMIPPVAIGTGKRHVAAGDGDVPLRLVDAKNFRTRVIHVTYRPADGT